MEPANLNSPDDSRVEALLRRSTQALPDDGFSARVLAELPPMKTAARTPRRLAIGAGASIGLIFSAFGILLRPAAPIDLPAIATEVWRATQVLLDPTFVVAVLVAAFSLAYAFRRRLRLV
jgi:hypothetical protein